MGSQLYLDIYLKAALENAESLCLFAIALSCWPRGRHEASKVGPSDMETRLLWSTIKPFVLLYSQARHLPAIPLSTVLTRNMQMHLPPHMYTALKPLPSALYSYLRSAPGMPWLRHRCPLLRTQSSPLLSSPSLFRRLQQLAMLLASAMHRLTPNLRTGQTRCTTHSNPYRHLR